MDGEREIEQAIQDTEQAERSFRDALDEGDERLDGEAEDVLISSERLHQLAKDAVVRAAMRRAERQRE